MAKDIHEIRDPIHVFVRLDSEERKVVDSRAFQRLRHIHQLALTYMVYPGATHRRFEHSLGVMELAGRVYDVVTRSGQVHSDIRQLLPEFENEDKLRYWRRVLRMAALCHDLGHLPFSHAAEKDLLPEGWNHERLTKEIILHEEMREIWDRMTPPLRPEEIVRVALGPGGAKDMKFTLWETILSEIITGDAFGVDRMDYLLRDSHHAGVPYGRFDHYRLIDCLRVLPSAPSAAGEEVAAPALGLEIGGLHTVEALLWARYLMFSQLYFHSVRRIYDIHLKDFLREWLKEGTFPTAVDELLGITDNEVNAAVLEAANGRAKPGHKHAVRIVRHHHFKCLYQRHPRDVKINPEPGLAIFEAAKARYGPEKVRYDKPPPMESALKFPVITKDGRIVSSGEVLPLELVPLISVEYVFVDRGILEEARRWLEEKRADIIELPEEAQE